MNAEEIKDLDTLKTTYGEKFEQLSAGEKEYLTRNYKLIRRITQAVLDRYGHSRIPADVIVNDRNMIEFYLHPNGSISDISFVQKSKIEVLNDTTRETIELAYYKYPRPKEKILIRYRVYYDMDKNESKKKK
ncbi:energy transducer TonB family protein [Sulfuricurvum sp.]|uniref:energy transducer TonB family protein n=1 Tax=Sulfuricurvum sp. TaxID=2025608 RepID=UPI003BB564A7